MLYDIQPKTEMVVRDQIGRILMSDTPSRPSVLTPTLRQVIGTKGKVPMEDSNVGELDTKTLHYALNVSVVTPPHSRQ